MILLTTFQPTSVAERTQNMCKKVTRLQRAERRQSTLYEFLVPLRYFLFGRHRLQHSNITYIQGHLHGHTKRREEESIFPYHNNIISLSVSNKINAHIFIIFISTSQFLCKSVKLNLTLPSFVRL